MSGYIKGHKGETVVILLESRKEPESAWRVTLTERSCTHRLCGGAGAHCW